MLQITLDVAGLTPAERSHVVAFITDYPTQSNLSDTKIISQETNVIAAFSFPDIDEEDEEEAEDTEDFIPSPESAFGPTLVPPPPPQVAVIPAPPSTNATTVQLDKNGLPWDERIHSSNKQFVADGTWRKRRGVDDAVVAQVEAELRAVMSIPAVPMQAAPVVPPPPPPAPIVVLPTQPPTPPIAYVAESIIPVVPAPPPPPPVAPIAVLPSVITAETPIVSVAAPITPVAPPPASDPNAFLNLIQFVTNTLTQKKATREQVEACITAIDPALNLQLMSKRPDLIPQVVANIKAIKAA